jgi:hypothetical protein
MAEVEGSGTAVRTWEIPYILLPKLLGIASFSTHCSFDLFDNPGMLPKPESLPSVNDPALDPSVEVPVHTLVS